MAEKTGATILVSLSQALEFLFEAEEQPAKGLESYKLLARKTGQCSHYGLS